MGMMLGKLYHWFIFAVGFAVGLSRLEGEVNHGGVTHASMVARKVCSVLYALKMAGPAYFRLDIAMKILVCSRLVARFSGLYRGVVPLGRLG
jgi:hypothetical protein